MRPASLTMRVVTSLFTFTHKCLRTCSKLIRSNMRPAILTMRVVTSLFKFTNKCLRTCSKLIRSNMRPARLTMHVGHVTLYFYTQMLAHLLQVDTVEHEACQPHHACGHVTRGDALASPWRAGRQLGIPACEYARPVLSASPKFCKAVFGSTAHNLKAQVHPEQSPEGGLSAHPSTHLCITPHL